ncbi:polysaccharide biosynthesis/export family protein [Sagittula sp. SSi028]|uniref:polysaccharide biosynthesis/export family protein n=1 Tax=Sagittula sp. SSi028 TaxID=3400636 RepID=UPI003AF8BE58
MVTQSFGRFDLITSEFCQRSLNFLARGTMRRPWPLLFVAFAFALAACSLPRGAALHSEIVKAAAENTGDFQVIPVTRANAEVVGNWAQSTPIHRWPTRNDTQAAEIIRTGDVLDVTVWDSAENSLLTNPGERYTKINALKVDELGSIFLPYVNKIAVRGLTPDAARGKIQKRLEPIVPSAQVQVSLTQGRGHAVEIVGGVNKPGSYPIPSHTYRILGLLADSGGITPDLRNPQVRLIRGGRTYEMSANALMSDGQRNVILYPKDSVIVTEDNRSFTAIGASGIEDLIYFPKDRLTGMEALSLVGGLSDTRADPEGLLVLRDYPNDIVGRGPTHSQVVFTFDLTTADGLFGARHFDIRPGDTVLATESPVSNMRTILGLFGSTLGLATQTSAVTN